MEMAEAEIVSFKKGERRWTFRNTCKPSTKHEDVAMRDASIIWRVTIAWAKRICTMRNELGMNLGVGLTVCNSVKNIIGTVEGIVRHIQEKILKTGWSADEAEG